MHYVTEFAIVLETAIRQINSMGSGSLIYHFAIVKSLSEDNAKQITTAISFERTGDVEAELASISIDIHNRWSLDDVLLVRRIGTLHVGDVISLIAVSASRSKDAFDACQYGLQGIKAMSTIRKQEIYVT